ncbi:MAG TPA: hypothetical protein PLL30_07450 [Candidatus Krumholzibacteria bacterium]|nr:hypothetical protein [Candidatus Krumholzibacteria bacterium]HPD71590.1 hypothetical protein [Candidatus Krumholzibacteria bacterium]HRY41477.1 hypothetical protein [Candidatus Krumholzibacteria bacterium]
MEHLRYRLRKLLLLLLEAVDARQAGSACAASDLPGIIAAAGYGPQDLADLLAALHGRWHPQADRPAWLAAQRVARPSRQSLRQMGPREEELLTVPAFGYLLDLVRTGQITAEQMETLIQFAQLVPDGPLTPAELGPLLDRVIGAGREDRRSRGLGGGDRPH